MNDGSNSDHARSPYPGSRTHIKDFLRFILRQLSTRAFQESGDLKKACKMLQATPAIPVDSKWVLGVASRRESDSTYDAPDLAVHWRCHRWGPAGGIVIR